MKHDLVSIILPVYNASTHLKSSLHSLLSQTYANIEIIVIDDNSKDDSYAVAKQLKSKDSRIRLYRNKKRYGLAICFNRAVKRARGAFVAFMDPTHVSAKNRIEKQVAFLENNSKVVAVGTQCAVIDHNNKKLGKLTFPHDPQEIYKSLINGISMQFESALINKRLLPKDILRFTNNSYPFIYTHVFIKFLQYGRLANLHEYLHSYRKTTKSAYAKLKKADHTLSLLKLWITSVTQYDYKPSLRFLSSFF